MKIDVCLSPALYPFYKQDNDIVIVVDIFRASTTICTMFNNGASSVITVASVEEAKEYKDKGYIVGGERNARKIDFADFGNSPFDYSREAVNNKEIVFTTTNGTHAIDIAKDCKKLFVGAFSNINAIAEECHKIGERVVIVCTGWQNRINAEDTLFAGAFIEKASQLGAIEYGSDTTRIALELWNNAKYEPIEYLKSSDHYQRLIDNNAEGDISYCFKENSAPVLPWYCKSKNKLRIE